MIIKYSVRVRNLFPVAFTFILFLFLQNEGLRIILQGSCGPIITVAKILFYYFCKQLYLM